MVWLLSWCDGHEVWCQSPRSFEEASFIPPTAVASAPLLPADVAKLMLAAATGRVSEIC